MRESINEPGRVYRTLSYGPHLDVFILDGAQLSRAQRSESADRLRARDAYFLGPDQMQWLKRALLNSTTRDLEGDRLRHARSADRV